MQKLQFLRVLVLLLTASLPCRAVYAENKIYDVQQCDFIDFSRLKLKPDAVTTQVVGKDTVIFINNKEAMKLKGRTSKVNYTTDKKNYYTDGNYNPELSRICNNAKKN